MVDSLLSTKLRPSGSRPKLVARPRLTARLEWDAGRKLTLVSAPAGFGRTTLLAKWLGSAANRERSVAWLSLDAGDNDPTRFLSYLVAALKTVKGGIGGGSGPVAFVPTSAHGGDDGDLGQRSRRPSG